MSDAGPVALAAELAALGQRSSIDAAEHDRMVAALDDRDPRVRTAALGALVRTAADRTEGARALRDALEDPAAPVRRRAAELVPALGAQSRLAAGLVGCLDDPDVTVVEAAAWALGELGDHARAVGAVGALSAVVRDHHDALAREAAVAALGALGDATGLPAILGACTDKPAVRRRAVLALAPFDGPEVDAALAAARRDRDWQVRQAAEDLGDG